DIIAFRDDLNLSIANELALTNTLVKEDIDASGKDMLKYIPSMTKKYIPKLQIQDGSLMYIGTDKKEEKWFNEVLGRESAYKIEKPAIKAGLTPIKWNASNAVVTTTDTDAEWSDYQNKKWANAQTSDGSMWTWIPRYAYRIIYYDKPVVDNQVPAGGNIVGYSDNRGIVDPNGKPSTAFDRLDGRVEIVFLGADNFKYLDGDKFVGDVRKKDNINNPNHYVVHPAFSAVRRTGYTKKADGNFGNTKEIPGFWVSKFEMGPDSVSIPDKPSQRSMTISDMFTLGRNLASKRGISGGDSNAMTTTQWGAVVYLTKVFGKEPDRNPSNTFTTGGGNYIANVAQSTTGNTTGIYDMNGCASENMAAYIADQTTTYNANLIAKKDTKYVDVYAKGANVADKNSCYQANADKYGDAQYEISSNGMSSPSGWSYGYSHFPHSTNPVFYRGGHYSDGIHAGVFAFCNDTGRPSSFYCWRRGLHFVKAV
ncbi:MAG: hypothetical protein RSC28_09455, partial [Bacteroidales bacterium]